MNIDSSSGKGSGSGSDHKSKSSGSSDKGALISGIVGGVGGLAVIAIVAFFLIRRRLKQRASKAAELDARYSMPPQAGAGGQYDDYYKYGGTPYQSVPAEMPGQTHHMSYEMPTMGHERSEVPASEHFHSESYPSSEPTRRTEQYGS